MRPWALILLIFWSSAASAAEPDRAAHAYREGRFMAARALGQSDGSADGLAWACRAGLVVGGYRAEVDEAVKDLHAALDDCRAAIALDPHHPFARISYAIALGFEGKRLKKASYARASRDEIEEFLAEHPGDPLALGALADWHAEVSNAGFLARLSLGANRKAARENFEAALKKLPHNLPLRLEYLKFLAYGDKAERAEALSGLEDFRTEPPQDAFDRLLMDRAEAIRQALQEADEKALMAALRAATAFSATDNSTLDPYPLDR